MARRLVCRMNSRVFFGESLCEPSEISDSSALTGRVAENVDFLGAAVQYPQDVFISGEALQLTPTFIAP